jgi:hypothetical protein
MKIIPFSINQMKFNRESKKLDASEGIKGFVP